MRHKLLFLLVAMLVTALPASAVGFWVGSLYFSNELGVSDETTVIVYGSKSLSGDINIPAKVSYKGSTYSVTTIGGSAFEGCTGLTSVNIPNSVTYIDHYAFDGCSGLTSVTIGNSVTSIGSFAFRGCTGLTSVNIPNSVTTIWGSAFMGCTGLTSVSIPSSVTEIAGSLFSGCSSLTSVSIPSSVNTIGSYAFYHCYSLNTLTIPESLTTIGSNVFEGCHGVKKLIWNATEMPSSDWLVKNSIEEVIIGDKVKYIPGNFVSGSKISRLVIPASVISIGNDAFSDCSSLTSITIPNSVKQIGQRAFAGCKGLASISLPNSMTAIEYELFNNCFSLATINIPESVTNINGWAFEGCKNLKSVKIPKNVKNIEIGSFFDCTGLRDIYCDITNPSEVNIGSSVFYNVPTDLCTLHVPEESMSLYAVAYQWKDFLIVGDAKIKKCYKTGFAEKNDWDKNRKDEPIGVTADGASQILMCVDRDVLDSNKVTFEILTKINGEKSTDNELVGDVSQVFIQPWDKKDRYCFVYTAPSDFIYNTNSSSYSVEISIVVNDDDNEAFRASTTIEVYRPGVLLLHGLLSDKGCFEGLDNHLKAIGYRDFMILNAEYIQTNAASFENNTFVHNVVGERLNNLFVQLANKGIVSAKYDLVGHSMGGILSRMYAQEVNPDAVNRIITLDTPHYGSQLAGLRNTVLSSLKAISALPVLTSPIVRNAFVQLDKQTSGNGVLAALENLDPNSRAISRLNDVGMNNAVGIPVHAICSVMTTPQENNLNINNPVDVQRMSSKGLQAIYDFLFNDMKLNGFLMLNNLYGGLNDGVVSLESQSGGLSGKHITVEQDEYNGFMGFKSKAHHCNTNKWISTYSNITSLLHSPKSSSQFSLSGFSPMNINSSDMFLAAAKLSTDFQFGDNENTFVRLTVDKNISDTTNLKIHVAQSKDIIRQLVYGVIGNDQILCDMDNDEYVFMIPKDYRGVLQLYALGRTSENILVADCVEVDYTNGIIVGDVNGDGIISGADVTALYSVLLDGSVPAGDADVNGDTVVSGADVTALYTILLEQ